LDFTNTVLVIIALLVVIAGLAIKLSNEIEMHKIYQQAFNRQVNENKHILNLAKEAQKFNENMLKEKENLINELNAEKMENIKHLNEIDKLESEIVNLNYQKQLDNGTLEFKDILEPTEVQNEEN
jgi:hypothetical protein